MREVPKLDDDPDLYDFLVQLRNHVVKHLPTTPTTSAPSVTNLRSTSLPLGVMVEWTRADADGYLVYVSDTPTIDMSKGRAIDAGKSSMYSDYVGAAAVTRYYWVRAYTGNKVGNPVGPVSGTTLASGAAVTIPPPLPASQVVRADPTIGNQVVGVRQGREKALLIE